MKYFVAVAYLATHFHASSASENERSWGWGGGGKPTNKPTNTPTKRPTSNTWGSSSWSNNGPTDWVWNGWGWNEAVSHNAWTGDGWNGWNGNWNGKQTSAPTGTPTSFPSKVPSGKPSTSKSPSRLPSTAPSSLPSTSPSGSSMPSILPSSLPSTSPSGSSMPSISKSPSNQPSLSLTPTAVSKFSGNWVLVDYGNKFWLQTSIEQADVGKTIGGAEFDGFPGGCVKLGLQTFDENQLVITVVELGIASPIYTLTYEDGGVMLSEDGISAGALAAIGSNSCRP